MSRLIPDSARDARPVSFTQNEVDFLLTHPHFLTLLRRAAADDSPPFRAELRTHLCTQSISPDFAAKLVAVFRRNRRRREVAHFRKLHPKRMIFTPNAFADE